MLSEDRRGRNASVPWECDCRYIDWYRQNSHPIVQNPERRRVRGGGEGEGEGEGEATFGMGLEDRVAQARGYLRPYYDAWYGPGDDIPRAEVARVIRTVYTTLGDDDLPSSSSRAGPSTSRSGRQGLDD